MLRACGKASSRVWRWLLLLAGRAPRSPSPTGGNAPGATLLRLCEVGATLGVMPAAIGAVAALVTPGTVSTSSRHLAWLSMP